MWRGWFAVLPCLISRQYVRLRWGAFLPESPDVTQGLSEAREFRRAGGLGNEFRVKLAELEIRTESCHIASHRLRLIE